MPCTSVRSIARASGGSLLVALLFAFCILSLPAGAQEPPLPEVPEKTEPDIKEPAKEPAPLREQTIYIPYKKLRDTFEKEGRGVFLPYEQFRDLWDSSRRAAEVAPAAESPIKALITEIDSQATVVEGVVQVEAVVSIDLLTEGWHEIPLRLGDAAVQTATIADKPARLVPGDGGYRLLVQRTGDKTETIELKLKYAKSYTRAPGQNRFEVQAPQASVNRWQIRIPEAGVKVQVHPLLAATEVPADAAKQDVKQPDNEKQENPKKDPLKKEPAQEKPAPTGETLVQAFVGAAPTVTIEWTPKAEGAAGLEVLATVSAQQETLLGEGVLRTTARLVYEISRSELTKLVIEVPTDQKVAGLFNGNVKLWNVETVDNVQKITVELFEPARERQEISLELEQFLEEADSRDVTVPVIKAAGVARQQGTVYLRLAEGLRGQTKTRSGLLQLDAGDIPQEIGQRGPWPFAYRYASLPFELVLSVEKEKPRIQVDELMEAYLEPEKLTVDLLAIYTIERAGVFELQLDVPDGYAVRRVEGQAVAGAEAVSVDTHRVEEIAAEVAPVKAEPAKEEAKEDKEEKPVEAAKSQAIAKRQRLIVSLSRKALGKVALLVELEKRLQDPNLLSPTGTAAELSALFPQVRPVDVERVTGRMVVYVPESLRMVPKDSTSLRNISLEEAYRNTATMRGGRFGEMKPVLSYAFIDQPGDLSLSVERRKPQVTIKQFLVGSVEPGVVKYTATFFVEVLYSGAKSLRIDLPTSIADKVRNTTTSIRDSVVSPAPKDLEKDYVAWNFTGERELFGNFTIELKWEEPIEKLDIGSSVRLAVPRLIPREVDRALGQIVLSKAETIDLAPAEVPTGLQPIDPQHDLMPGASVAQAALGYEFHEAWKLDLQATRFELQVVKTTSIERALVRMVVTRSDLISVQALYRLRSARQRLEISLPMDVAADGIAFDTQPLRINGRPVSLERGANDRTFYIPLVGLPANEPLLLELRYTQPGGPRELALPEFPEEPAVQKVYLAAYLPKEWTYLGSTGPWTDELRWYVGQTRGHLQTTQDDNSLIHWVTEGMNVESNLLNSFPTDGQMLLFSTIRPQAGDSLRLWTMRENVLISLLLLGIVAAGLLLLRRPILDRLAALCSLVVAIMLCGVFAPSFSYQLLDWKLMTAVVVVLLVWLGKWLFIDRPKLPVGNFWPRGDSLSAKQGKAATSPPVFTPTESTPVDPPADKPASGEQGGSSNV